MRTGNNLHWSLRMHLYKAYVVQGKCASGCIDACIRPRVSIKVVYNVLAMSYRVLLCMLGVCVGTCARCRLHCQCCITSSLSQQHKGDTCCYSLDLSCPAASLSLTRAPCQALCDTLSRQSASMEDITERSSDFNCLSHALGCSRASG